MKKCSGCGQTKTEDQFNKRSYSSDGLRSECRECQRSSSHIYYHENGGDDNKRKYYVKNRERLLPNLRKTGGATKYDPSKSPARRAVYRAVKNGTIDKPSVCELCRIVCTVEAHHHLGYSKQNYLDVQWLCRNCHSMQDHPEFAREMEKIT